jgi:hypothetical protein
VAEIAVGLPTTDSWAEWLLKLKPGVFPVSF